MAWNQFVFFFSCAVTLNGGSVGGGRSFSSLSGNKVEGKSKGCRWTTEGHLTR